MLIESVPSALSDEPCCLHKKNNNKIIIIIIKTTMRRCCATNSFCARHLDRKSRRDVRENSTPPTEESSRHKKPAWIVISNTSIRKIGSIGRRGCLLTGKRFCSKSCQRRREIRFCYWSHFRRPISFSYFQ